VPGANWQAPEIPPFAGTILAVRNAAGTAPGRGLIPPAPNFAIIMTHDDLQALLTAMLESGEGVSDCLFING
jgi:hypothetical protein